MPGRIPIATAILVRSGRVLLVHRRAERHWYPDFWDLPGGHIETGETPTQALIRECTEELDIVVTSSRPVALSCADPAIEMHAFVIEDWQGEPVNAAPDEHDDLGWFEAGQLLHIRMADPTELPDIIRAIGDGRTT